VPHAGSVYYERAGSGEPMLLVNGLAADHTGWAPQFDGLSRHFDVVVFDNPGIGQTTGPPGPYTTELFADAAAALLGELGLERVHVVGASMGGAIAQQIALRHPGRVRSLAVHCSFARADAQLRALLRNWQACADALPLLDLVRQLWLWVFTPRHYAEHGDALAELEREVLEAPFPQSAAQFREQAEACLAHDVLDRLGEIRAPTLVTVGDSDRLTPPHHSFAIRERIPGALLHVWPAMGHAPFWEAPDEFNELTRVFAEAQ
jgi:pimeloyl-ACP methyl ester carboxylesterase